MLKKILYILLTSVAPIFGCITLASPSVLLIADFNKGNQNQLGGYFSKFEQSPSQATVGLTTSEFYGIDGKSLTISANKDISGFCGAWMHFFDFRDENKEFLDTSKYSYLSFWVKGASGGERFTVRLADQRLIEIEDSVSVGKIKSFLRQGVTEEWQEVLVPLDRLPNLDRSKLGGITFGFDSAGAYTIYVDQIALKKEKDSILEISDTSTGSSSGQVIPKRTMWTWTVYDILKNKNKEQDTVFEVCQRENIGRIWLQLPLRHKPKIDLSKDFRKIKPKSFKVSLLHKKELREFIRKAHSKGIKVEGLDGYPEFAQKPYHFIPLAIVDSVIDYNKCVDSEERFDGVHFDNEPYLIIGWHDKERREQILKEFLELNIECQRRIDENSDMEFGVDVPFWWNAPETKTSGAIGDVTFNGERKPAVFFCIDYLDNIGIMNYRDTTYGVDGIIAHASPILEYANKVKKDSIYVGLEVFRYEPTEVLFPFGLPRNEFREAIETNAVKYGYLSRINGFRIQLLDDGFNVHIGIEVPSDPDEAMQMKINDTLAEIGHHLGVKGRKDLNRRNLRKVAANAQQAVSRNAEWENYQTLNIVDFERLELHTGFKATNIMLGKTTFADESYAVFKEQLDESENELIDFPSYRGTALHYFKVLDEKFRE